MHFFLLKKMLPWFSVPLLQIWRHHLLIPKFLPKPFEAKVLFLYPLKRWENCFQGYRNRTLGLKYWLGTMARLRMNIALMRSKEHKTIFHIFELLFIPTWNQTLFATLYTNICLKLLIKTLTCPWTLYQRGYGWDWAG